MCWWRSCSPFCCPLFQSAEDSSLCSSAPLPSPESWEAMGTRPFHLSSPKSLQPTVTRFPFSNTNWFTFAIHFFLQKERIYCLRIDILNKMIQKRTGNELCSPRWIQASPWLFLGLWQSILDFIRNGLLEVLGNFSSRKVSSTALQELALILRLGGPFPHSPNLYTSMCAASILSSVFFHVSWDIWTPLGTLVLVDFITCPLGTKVNIFEWFWRFLEKLTFIYRWTWEPEILREPLNIASGLPFLSFIFCEGLVLCFQNHCI